MTRFVIISAGRSGSEFLVSLLDSHPDVMCLSEVFQEKDDNFKSYVERGYSPLDILRITYEICQNKTRGFKLLYYQARGTRDPMFGDADVWHSLIEQEDIRVIHLVRDNGLARLISLKISETTDIWHYYTERDDNPIHVKLSLDECLQNWSGCELKENKVDEDFSRHPIIKVHYNELATDPESTTNEVQRFLGVKEHRLKNTLRKRHRHPFDYLENFNELKRHFEGTRWECFFTDNTEMK